MTDHERDEFTWFADQARELSAATPAVRRVGFDAADGTHISGLRYGDGPPHVALLHGAGLNAHTFDTTAIALGEPALSLDLPGHGDSSWRDDARYAPSTMGPAVAAALDDLAGDPHTLVGHSLGGMTAAWIAARHPDRVNALVLVDITPGIDQNAGPAILRAFYERVEFSSRAEVVEWAARFGMGGSPVALERGVFHNTRVRPDGVVEWKHHFARLAQSLLSGSDDETAPVLGDTAWADLAAVTVPVTLVRGTDGFISDAALAQFRERLPHARVIELPGGHNVQENDPAALADAIRSASAS